jgi:hypothetical protein
MQVSCRIVILILREGYIAHQVEDLCGEKKIEFLIQLIGTIFILFFLL